MRTIRLSRQSWQFDEGKPLGPAGGFGRVYAGEAGVAVKLLNVSAAAAKREMTLADALADRTFHHVVPVLDAGEDAHSGQFFVVMARCERSLREQLQIDGKPTETASIQILLSIVHGLIEVGNIAHRDLKPDNVLLHDGTWKIADFGIARFVEESTSLNTLKECLTPAYAAPEQWRSERATKATDVYALGCIAHALFTGRPPFEGEQTGDFRNKHLTLDPPEMNKTIPAKVRSLVSHMLRKSQDGRPSLPRILQVLQSALDGSSDRGGLPELARVDAAISVETARKEALADAARIAEERDIVLAREAKADLKRIRSALFGRIMSESLNATSTEESISLGRGQLGMETENVPAGTAVGKWRVVAAGKVYVQQSDGNEYLWSASLWFTDLGSGQEFRWYQLSFMDSPFSTYVRRDVPFAASPRSTEAAQALSNTMTLFQLAEKAKPIDVEDSESFERQWIARFTSAVKGQLSRPGRLPWD